MPYLNLDPDFFGHPKCLRLVSALGERAEGYLMRLWCHAAKYHPIDGVLAGYTEAEIERIAGWTGPPSRLVESLVCVGFLDRGDDAVMLHDWTDHQGHLSYLKQRAMLGAKARWHNKLDSHAKVMLKQCLSKQSAGKVRKGKVRKGSVVVEEEKKGVQEKDKEAVDAPTPPRPEQPHQTLLNHFLTLRGTPKDSCTTVFVAGQYRRHARSALALIREAGGLKHALAATDWLAAEYQRKGLSWTLDTVAKHLSEFARAGRDAAIARQHGLSPGQVSRARELADWLARVRPGDGGRVPAGARAGVSDVPTLAGGGVALPERPDG